MPEFTYYRMTEVTSYEQPDGTFYYGRPDELSYRRTCYESLNKARKYFL